MESISNAISGLATIIVNFATSFVSLLSANPLLFAILLVGVVFKGKLGVSLGKLFKAQTGK